MSNPVTKDDVVNALKRVKGPDLENNIVDLGLVSEVVLANRKAYFSITVPPERANELEPLREAAERVVNDLDGIDQASAVLTAESESGQSRPAPMQTPLADNGELPHNELR